MNVPIYEYAATREDAEALVASIKGSWPPEGYMTSLRIDELATAVVGQCRVCKDMFPSSPAGAAVRRGKYPHPRIDRIVDLCETHADGATEPSPMMRFLVSGSRLSSCD